MHQVDKVSIFFPFEEPDAHGFIFTKDCVFDTSRLGAVEIKHSDKGIEITNISINEVKGI